MAQNYKNKNRLKKFPFYSEEIKSVKRNNKKIGNINLLLNYHFFQELSNKQLSDILPFPPKRKKRSKRLTKHQILQNILPLYDSVVISRRVHTHRYYVETYDVEVIDNKSLDDSLFLAERSINDSFRDLLREKRSFKYNLEVIVF